MPHRPDGCHSLHGEKMREQNRSGNFKSIAWRRSVRTPPFPQITEEGVKHADCFCNPDQSAVGSGTAAANEKREGL
jgi:hypothetical protein